MSAPVTFQQWPALLLLGAALMIGIGIWQLASGNAAGTGVVVIAIAIAIADVVFVTAARAFRPEALTGPPISITLRPIGKSFDYVRRRWCDCAVRLCRTRWK